MHASVSHRSWEPIWDVRTRSLRVQVIVFDLLKQLRALRSMNAGLPTIDTIWLPPIRQLRVIFGDLSALCDAVDFIHSRAGDVGVAYGGPDDNGTLWIKFYKMWSADRPDDNQLQFIIWIDSAMPSHIVLEDSSYLVPAPIAGQTTPSKDQVRFPSAANRVFPYAWGPERSAWTFQRMAECERLQLMCEPNVLVGGVFHTFRCLSK